MLTDKTRMNIGKYNAHHERKVNGENEKKLRERGEKGAVGCVKGPYWPFFPLTRLYHFSSGRFFTTQTPSSTVLTGT